MNEEEVQEVVEAVDEHLQEALKHANVYVSQEKVRPSATMAFDEVDKARKVLDKIDKREWDERN